MRLRRRSARSARIATAASLPSPGRGPGRIVVNQAGSAVAGERVYTTLSRACARFLGETPPLAGIVRRDEHVRDAIRRQTLLMLRHPGSAAAVDVTQIALAL